MKILALPHITIQQTHLIFWLHTFRFLTTTQLQILFHHKDPRTIQRWIKDLVTKGYVLSDYDRLHIVKNRKPSVTHLANRARRFLIQHKNIAPDRLTYIWKERRRTEKFISHCLTLADIYIFFLTHMRKRETMTFFTKILLGTYSSFPKPLPDAYITVTYKRETVAYFLDLFDDYTPPFVLRRRMKQYLTYAQNGDWHVSTPDLLFPRILFVCPNDKLKKHIAIYGKHILEKSFETITFYVTTKKNILSGSTHTPIWEQVR